MSPSFIIFQCANIVKFYYTCTVNIQYNLLKKKILPKNKSFISLLVFILLWGMMASFSPSFSINESGRFLVRDSAIVLKDTADSIKNSTSDSIARDTSAVDSLKKKTSVLSDIVKYKAQDSIIIHQQKKRIYLFNKTQVTYQNFDLSSGVEVIDYQLNEVYAGRILDSVGELVQHPVFKQGDQVAEPDSIRFNYKTKKAIILNSYTMQDENHIKAKVVKKENDSTYFLKNGIITTAKDIDNPDYYILVRKAKFIPNKKVVAGFSNMYIADVPTPIALPFAYYPMVSNRTSGIIFPTYGEVNDRGYFLQNGGYYFVINDYFDLTLTGDYYTNGSYGLRAQSSYRKRYNFSGSFHLRYENLIYSQKGFPDYNRTAIYNLQWSHTQDSKSSPYSTFSASVNLGSSTYYQDSFNQTTSSNFLNNTLSSSVSYSRTFPTYPSINFSISATHSQNTRTQSIDMTLPAFRASVERIFPFSKRGSAKKGIIQNINFQYSVQADNRFNTTDSLFFSTKMFRDARNGVRHSIPISTNFKIAKYFSVGINGSLNETWQFKTLRHNDFDITLGKSTIDTIQGFDRFMTYSGGASLGTTIYGTFNFGKNKKIQAIRHVIRPSVSYGYAPSFDNYYEYYISDAFGTQKQYTRFEGGLYGIPGLSRSNVMSFSLSNTFEAKIQEKQKDSLSDKPEIKKMMLLNSLNLNSSYDFVNHRFAPVNLTGGTQLFNNRLGVNFGATFNPYAIDKNGIQTDKFNIANGGSLFRVTNANLTMDYSFSSRDFKKGENSDNTASGGRSDDLFGTSDNGISSPQKSEEEDREEEEVQSKDWYHSKMPWDFRLAYSLSYTNYNRDPRISNNSIMFSGNVDLTPAWRVGMSSGYDWVNKGITYTQVRMERDLGSFRMNFSFTPFGYRSSWYFFIGIKASMLSDLKYEKRQPPERVIR